MARPRKEVDLHQLKTLMRLTPTIVDTAAFFEVSVDTIERIIKKEWNLNFAEFREQNSVQTRLSIIRKIIQKAEAGDNAMLIWYSKNKLGWADKVETKNETKVEIDNVYVSEWGSPVSTKKEEENNS